MKRLALLSEIKSHKGVLFAKFTNEMDNAAKKQAWEVILDKARTLGLARPEHTFVYARDSLFAHWKRQTLDKVDKAKTTGEAGGSDQKLTEVDNQILDIIGRKSPVVEGLGTGEVGTGVHNFTIDIQDSETTFPSQNGPTQDSFQPLAEAARDTIPETKRTPKSKKDANRIKKLTEERLQAQIEVLHQQAYNFKLQNYELERKLGIAGSELTLDIQPVDVVFLEADSSALQ